MKVNFCSWLEIESGSDSINIENTNNKIHLCLDFHISIIFYVQKLCIDLKLNLFELEQFQKIIIIVIDLNKT